MDGLSKARSTCARRFCVRLALAFCLIVFGVGDAVERSLADHVGLESSLTHVAAADQPASVSGDHSGLHVDGQSGDMDASGQIVGHGCHGCAAVPERTRQLVAAPTASGASLAWVSVPSTAGREPLVDLPPPRA